MKKSVVFTVLCLGLLFVSHETWAQQKYFTKSGVIVFDAEGKLDDIEEIKAKTTTATCVYDEGTGNFEWAVPIKSFVFASSLMQEHFNENYLESSKYPKSTFIGKVEKPSAVNLSKDGTYPVKVNGKLTMHGVTQEVSVDGQFIVQKGVISANSSFDIALKDYKIDIPTVVFMKVADVAKVKVNANLQALKSK
ncbi:MAG: YceI family protein [Saprospiraceae bacterium]|nr:YceI family protein [Saprospiraceae bacterium]